MVKIIYGIFVKLAFSLEIFHSDVKRGGRGYRRFLTNSNKIGASGVGVYSIYHVRISKIEKEGVRIIDVLLIQSRQS